MAVKTFQEKKQEFEQDLILLKDFSNEITDKNQVIFEAIAKVQNAFQRKYTSAFICEEQTSPNLSDVIIGEIEESFKGNFVIKPKLSQIQTGKNWKTREIKIKKLLDLSVIYDSSDLDVMEDDTDVLIVVKSRIKELHNDDMFLQKGFDSGNLLIVINDEKLMDCNDIDDCQTCFPDEFKKKLNINGKPPIYVMDFRRLITPNPKPQIDMFSELGINDTYKVFLKTLKEQLSFEKRKERLIKNVDQARAKLTILKKLNDEKIKENINKTSQKLIEKEEEVENKIKIKTYESKQEFAKELNNAISNIDTSEPDTSNAGISDEDLERLRNISEQKTSEGKDEHDELMEDNKAREYRMQREHSVFAANKIISKIESESIKLQKEQKKKIKDEIENMIMSLFEDEEYAKYIYGIFEEEDMKKFDNESNETYEKRINDIKNKSNDKDSFLKDVIEISGSLIEEYGENLKVRYKEFTELLNGRLMEKFKSMKKSMVNEIYLYVKDKYNKICDIMQSYVQGCKDVLKNFQKSLLYLIDNDCEFDHHDLLNTFYDNEKNIYTPYINNIFAEENMDFEKIIELKKLTNRIFAQDPFKTTKNRLKEMDKEINQKMGNPLSNNEDSNKIIPNVIRNILAMDSPELIDKEKEKLKNIMNKYFPLEIDEEIHDSLKEIKRFQITEETFGK